MKNTKKDCVQVMSVLCMTFANVIQAQPAEDIVRSYGSQQLISLATGYQQPMYQAPAVATVITADDIRNSGARNLTEILTQVPGFHTGMSFIHLDTIYAVRGFSSSFNQNVLIMLDGVPQTDLFVGDRRITLGKIPIDSIARVEVVRGPGSALYGADAYTAVVDIITKKKAPHEQRATLSKGSFDTHNARAISGGELFGLDIVAAFEYNKTDGYAPRIERDQQTVLDDMLGTSASLAPSNANTQREEMGLHLNVSGKRSNLALRASVWDDIGSGIGYGSALDPFSTVESDVFEATYNYQESPINSLALGAMIDYTYVNYTLNNLHFLPPGSFGVFPDGVILDGGHKQTFWKLRLNARYTGFLGHVLSLGAGTEIGRFDQQHERRNYAIDGNGLIVPIGPLQDTSADPILSAGDFSRDLGFLYFQHEWSFYPDWTLTWGVRYDDYSDFGSTTNPRATLVWNARHDLTAKLLYGRSFRAPSLVETRSRNLPASEGNPTLDPEVLNTVEFAIDYRPLVQLRTGLNIFYHNTDKQIRQQRGDGPLFRPENVGDQTGRGLELELWWDISHDLKLYSYYTYQDNEDKTTHQDAGYTPHHKAYVTLQKHYRDWFFNLSGTYIGERDRVAEDTRPEADTYTFVDFLLRYQFSKHLEASLHLRNIFDKDAQEGGFGTSVPVDTPLPGRNYYFSLTMNY